MSWFTQEVQQKIEWRDGDVVISVPSKSGTTWTMNIVHQLREGGDSEFQDIYNEVPWLQWIDRPGRTVEELVERFNSMPTTRRRVFKTHSAPPVLPYFEPPPSAKAEESSSSSTTPGGKNDTKDIKYVVVVRNPEEAVASMYPFIMKHNPEFLKLWGTDPDSMKWPNFETYYYERAREWGMDTRQFEFMANWWPRRNNSNVLLLHYNDMKKDHQGTIQKISDFLRFRQSTTPEQWQAILEYTSFRWMKRHESKFEAVMQSPVPLLLRGAMLRRGESGLADQDGITEEISREIASRGQEKLEDEDAFWFLYKGTAHLTQTPMI